MDALTKLALAGMARASEAGSPDLATGTPLDGLLVGVEAAEPERRLLLAAGALAVYRQAGRRSLSDGAAPEPAPADDLPACSPAATSLLAALLSGQHAELLPEALALLRQAGRRLPPELLPAALSAGARQADLRPALFPVLGARGRWLARFNPDWRWAEDGGALPPDAATIWEEGTSERRLALLRQVRVDAPALGREWLEASWKSEKADFRAKAIAALAEGLSLADEPFLEAALDDRGQGVRAEAAALLARLPGSALATRMVARADALLDYRPPAPASGLRGLVRAVVGERGQLLVAPPTTLDSAWRRDGPGGKPGAGAGERAWWLTSALSVVPPEHWEERFAASPSDLITATAHDDWALPVIEGWTRATIAARSASWARPLWQWWYALEPRDVRTTALIPELLRELCGVMPPADVERSAGQLLATATTADIRWSERLWSIPVPWSAEFGARYLHLLRAHLPQLLPGDRQYVPWLRTLAPAARALPPACFAEALSAGDLLEPIADHGPSTWIRPVEQFSESIRMRQRVWQALEEPTR